MTDPSLNASYACVHCGSSAQGRNLVVCIDGTSNNFSVKNTNVVELYCQLQSDTSQLTYYNSGIGTYARPTLKSLRYWRQKVDHMTDLLFAHRFDNTVIGAYRWLSENYQKGDRIYVFGFARGAYLVRVLSAMIEKVGLIRRGNEEQIPFAFEIYRRLAPKRRKGNPKPSPDRNGETISQHSKLSVEKNALQDPDLVSLANSFKSTFSRKSVKVHFIGAWDTISGGGLLERRAYPHASDGLSHACFFRHALALDERRVTHLPQYAYGGDTTHVQNHQLDGNTENASTYQADQCTYDSDQPHVKEVWFRGSHAEIGGGNDINGDLDRGDPPLRWMSYEATQAGLKINTFEKSKFDSFGERSSIRGLWWLFELLPLPHLSYHDATHLTFMPHLGRGRVMKAGQLIHSTATPEDSSEAATQASRRYIPRAVLPEEFEHWKSYLENFTEKDLMDISEGIVKGLTETSPSKIDALENILRSVEQARALHDYVKALSHEEEERTQNSLANSFEQIVQTIFHRPGFNSGPDMSVCIQRDVRLYALCIRLLGLSQRTSISGISLDSNPLAVFTQSADIHIAVVNNQSLEMFVQGTDFPNVNQAKLNYTCGLDDHKTVYAIMRRASYFFANLHSRSNVLPTDSLRLYQYAPSSISSKWKEILPQAASGIFELATDRNGTSSTVAYRSTVSSVDSQLKWAYAFRFHADLFMECYWYDRIEASTVSFPLNLSHQNWGRPKHASVHRIIFTSEEHAELQNLCHEYVEPGEIGSKIDEWKPGKGEIAYADIRTVLERTPCEWATLDFSVLLSASDGWKVPSSETLDWEFPRDTLYKSSVVPENAGVGTSSNWVQSEDSRQDEQGKRVLKGKQVTFEGEEPQST